jgi:integrase
VRAAATSFDARSPTAAARRLEGRACRRSESSLRIGEATALTCQDIDLANGRISVGDSKTDAGIRLVEILPALRDELLSHRHANAEASPENLVFPTSSGSRRDKDNARERVIRPVVAHADKALVEGRDWPPRALMTFPARSTTTPPETTKPTQMPRFR